jgi:lactobin A/cerein 7B family class IIb bacteriocin
MVELNKKELANINGGGWGLVALIIGGISFIIGVFDGYTRPYRCR